MADTPTVDPWPNNVEFYAPWRAVSWQPENVTRVKFTVAAGEKRVYPVKSGRCYWFAIADQTGPHQEVDVAWGNGADPTDQDYDDGVPVSLVQNLGGVVRCPRQQDRLGVRFNKPGKRDLAIVLLE